MSTVTFDETKWQLVPIEPTPEMLAAGENKWGDPDGGAWQTYAAMLAAAPKHG